MSWDPPKREELTSKLSPQQLRWLDSYLHQMHQPQVSPPPPVSASQGQLRGMDLRMLVTIPTAQALCAAAHYMDQGTLNDEEADHAAFEFCLHFCSHVAEWLLPKLAEHGIATAPEIWLQIYEDVIDNIDQCPIHGEGDDDDLEGA